MSSKWMMTVAGATVLTVVPRIGLALAIGDTAPDADVKMKSVDGRQLSIKDVAGPKGTLVIFSCNHCPWVHAWEERLVAIANAAPEQGVGVIVVNSNDPAEYPGDDFKGMQERARVKGYRFPYVMDATSRVGRAFGATRTPEAFLFDAAGKLVYHGAIDDNAEDAAKVTKPYLRNAVDAVVAGNKPAIAETKAIGCSIKMRNES